MGFGQTHKSPCVFVLQWLREVTALGFAIPVEHPAVTSRRRAQGWALLVCIGLSPLLWAVGVCLCGNHCSSSQATLKQWTNCNGFTMWFGSRESNAFCTTWTVFLTTSNVSIRGRQCCSSSAVPGASRLLRQHHHGEGDEPMSLLPRASEQEWLKKHSRCSVTTGRFLHWRLCQGLAWGQTVAKQYEQLPSAKSSQHEQCRVPFSKTGNAKPLLAL